MGIGWSTTDAVSCPRNPRMVNFIYYDEYKVEASSPEEKLTGAAILYSGNTINASLNATGI